MGKIVCLVGPSGVGKSSYIKKLKKYLNFEAPQIITTRQPREDDDNHYTYVSNAEFGRMMSSGELIEWDKYSDYYYGTVKASVLNIIKQNNCVLDLTPSGCRQIKKFLPDSQIIALLPDDPSWLKKRLFERGTNNSQDIKERSRLLDEYIEQIKELHVATVYCRYSPSSWDGTFEEIKKKIK